MKRIIQIVFILSFVNCFSQFSKTHYIPPLGAADGLPTSNQYLYISTPNVNPVPFTIQEIGGVIVSGFVSKSTPYVYDLYNNNPNQFLVYEADINTIQSNKGYIIEADDIVYATIRVMDDSTNQAGELVSKGLAALGTRFRVGAFTNTLTPSYSNVFLTFVSILATENNTTVQFSDIKPGAVLINNAAAGNTPSSIVLNAGQSFVMAVNGPTNANRDALIGALVTSDKPIAVNCGSYGGSNGEHSNNMDLGFDQIVSAERTGADYIFIKSTGQDNVERVILVADTDNTEIYLSGNTGTPDYVLNAGQYVALTGANYTTQGNLYVHSSQNIFAYQCIGDDSMPTQADQELFFVPPLSCQTPKSIDNIPHIEQLGPNNFPIGRVTITTKTGSPLTFTINGTNYTLASLPAGISVVGPTSVIGNTVYECYTISGLTGNVSVFSTSELYLAAYGISGNATFGGYYSGFTFKPEISFNELTTTQSGCIPNINLSVNSLTAFDTFQWYFNGLAIPGATNSSYTPNNTLGPGYYYVSAVISNCVTSIPLVSDQIPVSDCAIDSDNDSVNDNIDLDNDNDGITNCDESFGDLNLNLTSSSTPTNISIGNYTNSFTGTITTAGTTAPSPTPFVGNTDGTFVTEVPAGKENAVTYQMNFTKPISVEMEYVPTANVTDLINSNGTFIVRSSTNKTITVLNPDNQLLIDTNYDNIYESGVTEYSSFEIRFRVNNSVPLAAGTGTFSFRSNLTNSFSFTQSNLSDTSNNRATFKIIATCVPKDSDGDGIPDQLDLDSDNDGIPDSIEAQGSNPIAFSNTDLNHDGIYDIYGTGLTPVDTDHDGIPDYLDLDSDNDGIYDLVESGSNAPDLNHNGVIDGNASFFGTNGLANCLETSPDSGILNYTVADTDNDGIKNYIDLDSDGDGCNDVIEAGFLDPNNDGYLGNSPISVNLFGIVTSGVGYTTPNINYITPAPINITTQPLDQTVCELQMVTFTTTTNPVDSYQWQVSTNNGTTWTNLVNNANYSGVTTISLSISSVLATMNGYQYRVFLNKNGNSCGLYSSGATLSIYSLPVLTSPISLKQCGTTPISDFNLTVKNDFISANAANETFTYFHTQAGAYANDVNDLITNPIVYHSGNGTVWVRVVNANGCFAVGEMDLIVSITQLTYSDVHRNFVLCDDSVAGVSNDTDGTSVFDFSSETALIQSHLTAPLSNYSIKYYANEADALAEINDITASISNYRNTILNQQQIYVRVDSVLDNSCFGLDAYVTLTVEALPIAHSIPDYRFCDDDNDGIFTFDTSALQTNLLQGQTNVTVTYFDANNAALPSPFPSTFTTTTQTIKAVVTNNTTNTNDGIPCHDETFINFIVDIRPIANPVVIPEQCDDENPSDTDGLFSFDTTTIQNTILNGQTGMNINYQEANGTILNSLPNPFVTGTQDVMATVTNPINTSCPATTLLHFVVHPKPNILLTGDGLVCANIPSNYITLSAGILDGTPTTNYTYVWTKDGTILPDTTPTISVNSGGIYTVQVINTFGCSRTRNITIIDSDVAHIQNIDINDLTDINSITISVNGTGNYEYSLDQPFGPFQVSNFFDNVTIGVHQIYINDTNGCGITEQTIFVIGAPKFFTPNGDGFDDYWNIKGIDASTNSQSTIYIFDRFGKLLKQISPLSQGWDGTYNGQQMPADDYWFTLQLQDGRNTKGHFSLKR